MSGKYFNLPPCAVGAGYGIICASPRNGRGVEAVAKVDNPYIWPFGWDVAMLIYSDCGDFDPSRAAFTSNGVEAEMKKQKIISNNRPRSYTCVAIGDALAQEYCKVLAIVRKHCGRGVLLSEMVAPLLPSAGFVAGCVIADWCNDDDERAELRADLEAAGIEIE